MRTLLVTGGIGSGKSLVCAQLERKGIPVYDFDSRTKVLYDEDPVLLSKVVEAMAPFINRSAGSDSAAGERPLCSEAGVGDMTSGRTPGYSLGTEPSEGSPLLTARGLLDRRALAAVVFSDPQALAVLEAMVHPAVLRDFEAWRDAQTGPLLAAESAIALSKPLFSGLFDIVLLVDAPEDLRLSRAALRDGVSAEAVGERMRSQTADPSGRRPDYVIVNDKSEVALAAEIDKVLIEILKYED